MTYTCFPNQNPFPLPPGVTTPPSSPSFTDNGPQTPPNSIDLTWENALISTATGSANWLDALISADVPVDNWQSALIGEQQDTDYLDLCELVGLLDLLPDDDVFVPELEDAATPVLPPYVETLYAEVAVRVVGSWFFVPGGIRVDAGPLDAVTRLKLDAGNGITTLVDTPVHVLAISQDAGLCRVRVKAEAT
jgi:hypothetical protein